MINDNATRRHLPNLKWWGGCLLIALALPPTSGASEADAVSFSYEDYAAVLDTHVDAAGLVNYKGLKANRRQLDRFINTLGSLHPDTYAEWIDEAKIAFWVNAYNALTLQAIIDHYPIKASWAKSFVYPKNSIRQISGVWDTIRFPVQRREVTLNAIEHNTLREKFDEPRIHMALVCASIGCPFLRNEPFTAERLNEQLDDQTRKFLAHERNFKIDSGRGTLNLSSIFEWFGEDFVKKYGAGDRFRDFGNKEKAVLNFISGYLDDSARTFVSAGKYSIAYIDYDWSLNEKQ